MASGVACDEETEVEAAPARVSRWAAYYVLVLLFLISLTNYIDRSIIGVLAQAIKVDLRLSDFQIGLLGGPTFALLYGAVSIPIARLAERLNRVNILSFCLALWAGLTALSGFAGGFVQLFLARVGVGMGEGACTPVVQSLTGDFFPPHRRATVFGLISISVPAGGLLAAIFAGWLTQTLGWRAAFLVVGIPGVLLALLFRLTVSEPVRGRLDPEDMRRGDEKPSLFAVLRLLFSKRAFLLCALGSGLANFANLGLATFTHAFIVRRFDIGYADAAFAVALVAGFGGILGTMGGGFIADRLGQRDPRWYVWFPALGLVISTPFYVIALFQPSWQSVLAWMFVPAALHSIYLATLPALTLNMSTIRMRASAAAIMSAGLITIGYGFGPTIIGHLSDSFTGSAMASMNLLGSACHNGVAVAGSAANIVAACKTASALGARDALVVASCMYVAAGISWALAGRTLRKDLEVKSFKVGH